MAENSDDSDIIIDYQLKPVNSLTRRAALLIKNNTLRQTKINFTKTGKSSTDIKVKSTSEETNSGAPNLPSTDDNEDQSFLSRNRAGSDGKKNSESVLAPDQNSASSQKTCSKSCSDSSSRRRKSSEVPHTPSPKKRRGIEVKKTPNENKSPVRTMLSYITRTPVKSPAQNTTSPREGRISVRCDLIGTSRLIASQTDELLKETRGVPDNFKEKIDRISSQRKKEANSVTPKKRCPSESINKSKNKEGKESNEKKGPSDASSSFVADSGIGTIEIVSLSDSEEQLTNNENAVSNDGSRATPGAQATSARNHIYVKKSATPEKHPSPQGEKITLSPGIKKRRNRFKSISNVAVKSPEKPRKELFHVPRFPGTSSQTSQAQTKTFLKSLNLPASLVCIPEPSDLPVLDKPDNPYMCSSGVSNRVLSAATIEQIPKHDSPANSSSSQVSESPSLVNGSIDATILGSMMQCVLTQQDYLKTTALDSGRFFESLLNDFDQTVLEKYFCLDQNSQTLLMRMFFRKPGWHRVSTLKYDDLSHEMRNESAVLSKCGLFKTDIENEDLRVLLRLLKMPELTKLSRTFSIPVTGTLPKGDLIDSIVNQTRQQKSVADMFKSKKSSLCSRAQMVFSETCSLVGPCIQLDPECRKSVGLIVLLFSLAHDVEDENKRESSQRHLMHQVITHTITFVEYNVVPTVVFETRDDLIQYKTALDLRQEMDEMHALKLHDRFTAVGRLALANFKKLLSNQEYRERIARLPCFLRRFNAGSVYVSMLTSFCEFFKLKTDKEEIVIVLQQMLAQKTFGVGSRGKWYEMLAQTLQTMKRFEESAQVLCIGSKDILVDEVKQLALKLRAKIMLKGKKSKIKDDGLRAEIEIFAEISFPEPPSIEINAEAMGGNVQGSKLVYIQETATGKRYSSVEEQAVYYYKSNGFPQGYHGEGFIVSTIFYMFFFDLIYSATAPGVFISPYQTRPLDMSSSAFLANRAMSIQSRLNEMTSWTDKDVAERIEHVFARYMGQQCVIAWKDNFTPKLFCEIISCLNMQAWQAVCKRMAFQPGQARSGFPDLTVWNPHTKQLKFVEVKSPKDSLMPNQRVWLNYLQKHGIPCELCNVRNVGGKQRT